MAAPTKTEICNLALSLIGDERLQLTDVDTDGTKSADQCLLHYDRTLEELVRMHTWNCSKARDQLTTSAYTEHEWDFSAPLPSDSIRPLVLVSDDSSWNYFRYSIDWVVEGSNILTNYEDPYLLYIKTPAFADMDSLFLQAFYTLLAAKIAIPLTGDRNIRGDLLAEFMQVIMPEARRVNSFEGKDEQPIQSDWLNATLVSSSSLSDSWPPFDDIEGSYGVFGWS